MPTVTIADENNVSLTFNSNDSVPFAESLAQVIGTELTNGTLTSFAFVSGPTAPGPASGTGGALVFSGTAPGSSVAVPVTDSAIIDADTGPLSITGGAAGEFVLAGSGGLNYTNITPSGSATDTIVAGDGNNLIETSSAAPGNYTINTGSGNDTISVTGNATVNAGTGTNAISVSGGGNLIQSEGFDSITGSTVAGGVGVDTVEIGSGQTTINPGASNFFIFGASENPLDLKAGSGSDTVSVGRGGGEIVAGAAGHSSLFGGSGGAGSGATTLRGTADGDKMWAIGGGNVTITGGAGGELLSDNGFAPLGAQALASTGDDLLLAGTGNDTLVAGHGSDTLSGGQGFGSVALMESGSGADIFNFTNGRSGGQDTITGFKATDTLQFSNYGLNAATALSDSFVSGGNLIFNLSDGTSITMQNVTNVSQSQIKAT
jgi:Ca2+-binding RTX toxin-like protein